MMNKATVERNTPSSRDASENLEKQQPDPVANEECTDDQVPNSTPTNFREAFGKVYLYAFCVFNFAHGLMFYNTMNVLPFYLNTVLGANPLFVGYLYLPLCGLRAVATVAYSVLYQKIDSAKLLTWLECRMLFAAFPMSLQAIFIAAIPFSNSVEGVTAIVALCTLASSTIFSGGIYTTNYEIDPANSALRLSLINSFGQMAGFVGPILMAVITYTAPDTQDYDLVYSERWKKFFWVIVVFPVMGFSAVIGSYLVRRKEWVPWQERNHVSD